MDINLDQLKRQAEQRPLEALAVGAMAVTAVAKLVDALSSAQGRRAYAKDVNRRVKSSRR